MRRDHQTVEEETPVPRACPRTIFLITYSLPPPPIHATTPLLSLSRPLNPTTLTFRPISPHASLLLARLICADFQALGYIFGRLETRSRVGM